jgi:hypothetical protein
MVDAVKQAAAAIERRLGELREEQRRLEGALDALGYPGRDGQARSAGHLRAGRAPRATRGQRQVQFLDAVGRNPGAPIPQLAREMGLPPARLYAIARKLRSDGRIKKNGRGYAVRAPSP